MSEIIMSISNPAMNSDMVINFKTARVVLNCDESVAWTRDGEFGGAFKKVTLRNCREQLRVLVPEQYVVDNGIMRQP
jgi:diacylglycerol kinase family enzyme